MYLHSCSVCTKDFVSNIGKEPTDTGITDRHRSEARML